MTSEASAASASLNKNQFGDGAKINVQVHAGSSTKKRKPVSAAIIFNEEDEDAPFAKWLKKMHLSRIFNQLDGVGVVAAEDLLLLDEDDLQELNLKKLELKKLRRAIATLQATNE